MNNYIIAILITTFLRDNLLYKNLHLIVENYPKNCIILIADQGYTNDIKAKEISYYKSQIPLEYYQLPFDCGLSYARNFLIKKAYDMNIPFILMSADSIQFTQQYNFELHLNTLRLNPNLGIIGFELNGSKCPWEFLMEITPTGVLMKSSTVFIEQNTIKYKQVDICRNIFLAKTSTILDLYDNEMKLCEHELAFLEYKRRNYFVWWTDSLIFKKINPICSNEYLSYRKQFSNYQQLFKNKLRISGWVKYSPEAMKEIKQYKRKYKIL